MIPTEVYEGHPEAKTLSRANLGMTICIALIGALMGFLVGLLVYGTGDDTDDACSEAAYALSDYSAFQSWLTFDYKRSLEAVWTGNAEGFTADLTPDALLVRYNGLLDQYPLELATECFGEDWE